MAEKLSAKQVAQLAWLETVPRKLERIHRGIEQLASHRVDATETRSMQRLLDELKAQASTLGITSLGDTFGYMGMLLRRGGGHQLKVRGLREMLAGVKVNFEGAMRAASTPLENRTPNAP